MVGTSVMRPIYPLIICKAPRNAPARCVRMRCTYTRVHTRMHFAFELGEVTHRKCNDPSTLQQEAENDVREVHFSFDFFFFFFFFAKEPKNYTWSEWLSSLDETLVQIRPKKVTPIFIRNFRRINLEFPWSFHVTLLLNINILKSYTKSFKHFILGQKGPQVWMKYESKGKICRKSTQKQYVWPEWPSSLDELEPCIR